MHTDHSQDPVSVVPPLSIKEIVTLLIKTNNLHEGYYSALIEFQIGVGPVASSTEEQLPGAMIGVSRFGLLKSKDMGPNTVDASQVNPQKKKRSQSK
jgi:hypothetical protein